MDIYQTIHALIRRIPKGKVATYGQIAQLAGASGPRRTAYALRILEDRTVPWWRVINAQGRISKRSMASMKRQQKLLENEGIVFSKSGRVSFSVFRWQAKKK